MTHLHQGKSPSSFSDYASDYDAVQSVRAPALACALLVFDQVSVEQSEATGPGVIAAVEPRHRYGVRLTHSAHRELTAFPSWRRQG